MKRVILLLAINLFCVRMTQGQTYSDIFNSHFQYFPSKNVDGNDSRKISSAISITSFTLPLERKNKDLIIVAGEYTAMKFSETGSVNASNSLSGLGVYLGYRKQWKNEKWRTLVMAISKVNTDLSMASSGDMQYGGLLMFHYKKSEKLSFHLGLYYNREYFGNYFLPMIGIDWRIRPGLALFGDFPRSLNLEKRLSSKFYTGLYYWSTSATYRPDQKALNQTYLHDGHPKWGHREVRLYLNYYLTKHLVVYAEVGKTISYFFQWKNKEDEEIAQSGSYLDVKDPYLIGGGIAYRFRLDEK